MSAAQAPPVDAARQQGDETPGLTWAIKRRFLRYIAGMADGRCSVTDGAELRPASVVLDAGQAPEQGAARPTNRFHYQYDGLHSNGVTTSIAFTGDVRFSGHHNFLFVRIADPVITVDRSGRGVLTIASPDPAETRRLQLAHVQLERVADADTPGPPPEFQRWLGAGPPLTPEGAELFGGAYTEGEPLDELQLILPHHHLLPRAAGPADATSVGSAP